MLGIMSGMEILTVAMKDKDSNIIPILWLLGWIVIVIPLIIMQMWAIIIACSLLFCIITDALVILYIGLQDRRR